VTAKTVTPEQAAQTLKVNVASVARAFPSDVVQALSAPGSPIALGQTQPPGPDATARMAEADPRFWDAIAPGERAGVCWALSAEMHALAGGEPDVGTERRLPRSASVLRRR
jgi:hypothetical protein